jgi:hypothetical protein
MNTISDSNDPTVNYLSDILFVKGAGIYALILATLLIVLLWEKHNTLLVLILFGIIMFQSYIVENDQIVKGRIMFMVIISLAFMSLSYNNKFYKAPMGFANKQILGMSYWIVPYIYILLASVDELNF